MNILKVLNIFLMMNVMYRSPTFLGCCFAISVEFFKDLGTYDPGYQIWGAENLELSFKVRLDVNIGNDSINLSLEGGRYGV